MKRIDIKPIAELDDIRGSGHFVRVTQDGKRYTCQLKNGQGFTLTLRVRPPFRVYGRFILDDYEVPELGLKIDEWLMQTRGLSVSGVGNCLVYQRHFKEIPKGPYLRDAVQAFVSDVVSAYPEVVAKVKQDDAVLREEVDRIRRDYLNN